MTATDDDNRVPAGGRDVVDQLCSAGALDGLFEQIDAGQVKMTGADGLLPALVKEALERGLAAELTEHLGYDKGEPTTQARGNARNGTTSKMVGVGLLVWWQFLRGFPGRCSCLKQRGIVGPGFSTKIHQECSHDAQ